LKILHIYKNYYPVIGGIENYVKMLAEHQVTSGCDVTVLATSLGMKTSIEYINGVRAVKAACLTTVSRTPLSLAFLKWIRHLDADITHLHFPYPWGELSHLFLGRARRTVITYHSDIIKQKFLLRLYKPFLERVLINSDRIIATSPRYIETSPFLRNFREKCSVIPLGIDIERFNNPDMSLAYEIKKRYDGSEILLFVGRLRYFKGLKYLVEAMEHIDARLLIIGTGPEEAALKSMVSDRNIGGKIVFLGDVSDRDLPSYYAASDIFVLPSSHRSEAFGTVLIEAMASGKPVISTELGTGTSFININGETGFVVSPKSPESLSLAVRNLLKDPGLRLEMGRHARERAKAFSKDVTSESVLKLYKEVLDHEN
jgi:rhamnosyl/mannosyltransferase